MRSHPEKESADLKFAVAFMVFNALFAFVGCAATLAIKMLIP